MPKLLLFFCCQMTELTNLTTTTTKTQHINRQQANPFPNNKNIHDIWLMIPTKVVVFYFFKMDSTIFRTVH